MICRKDPRQAEQEFFDAVDFFSQGIRCFLFYYVLFVLGTLIHPICSINLEETPAIFFILKHFQFVFHVGVWFFDVFFGQLEGAPFDVEKFDEFFRMVSAVHEDGRWKVKATRYPRGEQFEHYLERVAFIRIARTQDFADRTSMKMMRYVWKILWNKKIHRSISDTRCRAHLTPRDILRLVATFFFVFFRPWRMTTSFVWWRPVHLMCSRKASDEAWRAWWAWAFDIVWLNCSAIAPCDFAVSAGWSGHIWTYLDISGYVSMILIDFLCKTPPCILSQCTGREKEARHGFLSEVN